VITLHGVVFREVQLLRNTAARLRGELDASYERRCVRNARHIIALSPYVVREFSGVITGRTYLVPNAVAAPFFHIERRPEPGRILFAGLVTPRKGLTDLIRAIARAAPAGETRLRVAGDTASYGEYYASLLALAKESGLEDRIQYLGFLSETEMFDEYARAAVLALPSYQETLPVVVQQAMAARLPVVATRVGGIPDMIEDGRSGLLVEPGDVGGLSRALSAVLSDLPRAAALAAAANKYAISHFTAQEVARRTVDVYRQVIADWERTK
jgi:glycosyltransferase involved in cell wall biosynthesis